MFGMPTPRGGLFEAILFGTVIVVCLCLLVREAWLWWHQ